MDDRRRHPRFEHEKLLVFWKALDALRELRRITHRSFPRRGDLRDQLERAAASVPLNIAEAAAEHSPAEKARIFRIARRSAGEAAAILPALPMHAEDEPHARRADALLGEVSAMLVTLVRKHEAAALAAAASSGAAGRPQRAGRVSGAPE